MNVKQAAYTGLLVVLAGAYANGLDARTEDYYCDVIWETTCISNYCHPLLNGGSCELQSDDCECIL